MGVYYLYDYLSIFQKIIFALLRVTLFEKISKNFDFSFWVYVAALNWTFYFILAYCKKVDWCTNCFFNDVSTPNSSEWIT